MEQEEHFVQYTIMPGMTGLYSCLKYNPLYFRNFDEVYKKPDVQPWVLPSFLGHYIGKNVQPSEVEKHV